jgi:glucosamine-6-phosphate deaminase
MALTVGVATVLDSREVVVVVTGLRKALALSKAIGKPLSLHRITLINSTCLEEGVNHLVSIILLFAPPNGTHFILQTSFYKFQWTLSALQLHPWALIVVDEDATAGMSYFSL